MATCQLSVEKQMFKEKSCKQALQVAPTAILRHYWTFSYVHLSLLLYYPYQLSHATWLHTALAPNCFNMINATLAMYIYSITMQQMQQSNKQLFKKTSTIYSKFYHGINCHIVLPPRLIL